MEQWYGMMDWPLDAEWTCEICGYRGLTWGKRHAMCRCDGCHAEYWMRDMNKEEKPAVTTPISALRPEYLEAFKIYFPLKKTKIDEMDQELWKEAFDLVEA